MPDPAQNHATDDLLYFNGINGETGDYDLPPMTGEDLAKFIKGEAKPENLSELRHRYESKDLKHLGVKEGVDPKRLDQSGWGIIFAHDADPAIKEALAPLLNRRASQAGERFRVYEGGAGHRPDEPRHRGATAGYQLPCFRSSFGKSTAARTLNRSTSALSWSSIPGKPSMLDCPRQRKM
jgi:hypothetical protein